MRVDFWGLLPEGAELFPGDHLDATGRLAEVFGFTGIAHLDATGRLAEVFGFTGIAHLTVRDGKAFQGEVPPGGESAAGVISAGPM